MVEPAYGRRSLTEVVPAVATALGVELPGPRAGASGTASTQAGGPTPLVLPPAPAYVVLLVDGLGARLLERYAHAAPYLSGLLAGSEPGTAGVPSTTATSLSSLGTALVPGGHGLIGFSARVPGTDRLMDHLSWDKRVDPAEWQPHATAFSALEAAGVATAVVNKREFRSSGLTTAALRGAEFVGADRVGERIAAALTCSARRPSLTYLYDADLDWTGHRYGVASTAWLQQLAMIDAEAEQLRESLPSERRLLIVADHGMVDVPHERRVDVDADPVLRDGVLLLGGEARFRHLYCRGGAVDDVVAAWRSSLGERAEVLTRAEAVGRGWFGDVEARVLPRIGDVVVVCHGDLAVVATERARYESTLIGLHGSLSPDEMLIPLLVD